ncbi:MAG: alpha/beta hydrolase [Propionibacteriaceae bacterium]|nr:alpha/beta hydrolase [Propionibacteriaceae bacterium]
MSTYSSIRVPVAGGELVGGMWTPETDAGHPAVLAIHGITATHVSWPLVAEGLHTRVVALDLRGRGRSNGLPGPFGLRAHAADMAAVIDHLGLGRVVVAGHSMGAFVAVRLAEIADGRVASLVLIDGGLPIAPPAGVAPEDVAGVVLGPALARLSKTFSSRAEYRDFWRDHPALGPYWNERIGAYIDYDLDGAAPQLRPSSNPDAVAVDSMLLDGQDDYHEALSALGMPVAFLHAPRGLADQVPPLYPDGELRQLAARYPHVTIHELDDVNHYTIVLTPQGAAQVVPIIEQQVVHAATEEVIA